MTNDTSPESGFASALQGGGKTLLAEANTTVKTQRKATRIASGGVSTENETATHE